MRTPWSTASASSFVTTALTGLSIVKSASLASEPLLQTTSCAVTRTRAWVVMRAGTVHGNEPLFATPVAITVG